MSELNIDESIIQWNVAPDEIAEALRTRPLLVLLHGYGSFEGDLISLAPFLPKNFVCASLRAPVTLGPPIVNGFGWYEIIERGNPDVPALNRSTAAVLAWLDALDARVPGGLGEIALMGFSQGGCMVSMLMRARPERFAAGVICSGFIAEMDTPGDALLAERRPPVFWGRDENDPIILPQMVTPIQSWLPVHSTLVSKLYPGIQHSISREELGDINEFLSVNVPGATVAEVSE